MKALETYLPPEFLTTSASGWVHSVFTHALNIVLGETMITVHGDPEAGIPDSIVMAPEDFNSLRQLQAGTPGIWDGDAIHLPGQSIMLENVPNHSNVFPVSSCPACEDEVMTRLNSLNFNYCLPDKAEELLPKIISAAIANDLSQCEKLLPGVIGLGSGLTPSADDALIGIMAVMAFYTAAGIAVSMPDFPVLVYRLSEGRTTDVSRKYLRCAAQGRFALPLIHVVRSLLEGKAAFDHAAQAQLLFSTGHTSGRDTFRGLFITLSK